MALVVDKDTIPSDLLGICTPTLVGLIDFTTDLPEKEGFLDYDLLRDRMEGRLRSHVLSQAPVVIAGSVLLSSILARFIANDMKDRTMREMRLLDSLGVDPGEIARLRARVAVIWSAVYLLAMFVLLFLLVGRLAFVLALAGGLLLPTLYLACRRRCA